MDLSYELTSMGIFFYSFFKSLQNISNFKPLSLICLFFPFLTTDFFWLQQHCLTGINLTLFNKIDIYFYTNLLILDLQPIIQLNTWHLVSQARVALILSAKNKTALAHVNVSLITTETHMKAVDQNVL